MKSANANAAPDWVTAIIALMLALGSATLALFAVTFARELAKLPPGRMEGGHGFAVNFPVMGYIAGSLFCGLTGILVLIAALKPKAPPMLKTIYVSVAIFLLPSFYFMIIIFLRIIKLKGL